MSDDQNKGGTPPPEADPIHNIKQEFTRKQANTDAQIAELKKANEALMAKLAPPAAAPTEKKLSDLMYEDPDAFVVQVAKQAERSVMSRVESHTAQQQKQNQVIAGLVNDFPELSQMDAPLTKKSLEVYNGLSDEEKASPMAYKLAVKEAALELGVKPRSKRGSDNDDFTLGSGGGTPSENSRRGSKKDDLAPEVLQIARALGRPVDDPKYVEKLKGVAKGRKNWLKYE